MTPLAGVLTREIDQVSRFVQLLKMEQEVLKSGRPDDLSTINEEKVKLVEQLNQLGAERVQSTGALEPTADQASMASWLAQQPQEKQSAVLWAKLIQIAREAKELHDLNGQLIGMHLRQTNDALAILTERQQENTLYGSNGQSSQLTGSRIVDSA